MKFYFFFFEINKWLLQIFESTYYKIYEREYEIYYFGYVQRNIFLYAEEIVGMKAMVFFFIILRSNSA